MNVLIFGASGATGRRVVESALAERHAVTAFVRDRKRLPLTHDKLLVYEGDAMDRVSVATAVKGADAVISAIGTMPEGKANAARCQPEVPVCSESTRNILAALNPQAGRRLIVESGVSVGDSYATGMLGAGFLVRLALKKVMADKAVQEALIMDSDCDWTIVRPVKLTNKPPRGNLKAAIDLRWNITSTATRADVASYMVNILEDRSTYGKAITLKN